jgi:hypothetical protein
MFGRDMVRRVQKMSCCRGALLCALFTKQHIFDLKIVFQHIS